MKRLLFLGVGAVLFFFGVGMMGFPDPVSRVLGGGMGATALALLWWALPLR